MASRFAGIEAAPPRRPMFGPWREVLAGRAASEGMLRDRLQYFVEATVSDYLHVSRLMCMHRTPKTFVAARMHTVAVDACVLGCAVLNLNADEWYVHTGFRAFANAIHTTVHHIDEPGPLPESPSHA